MRMAVCCLMAFACVMPRGAQSQEIAAPAVSFANDVMPILGSRGCNTTDCHGSVEGKGGLKLSMFGAEPEQDYTALTVAAKKRRINVVEPAKSLLLLKATAAVEHGGKQRIAPGSPQYEVLAAWLAHGAQKDDAGVPKFLAIEAAPRQMTLAPGKSQQVSATAEFSDGTRKDITRDAIYRVSDAIVAAARPGGLIEAASFGQADVVVTFNRRSTVVRVVVPQPLPAPMAAPVMHNKIDDLVFAKLKELGIPSSELCTDQEFFRRVHLDVIGTLPTPEEVRAFLADKDPQKRSKLIDRLLSRSEFADFVALKWGDLLRIKSEYPSNLWPNAVQAYYAWLRDSIAANKPYDQFARELLVSTGSNFRDPTANYYRAMKKRDPQGFAEATALVFMGARLDCASCHGHPTETWALEDNLGMAAFFAQIKFKSTKEWKEEIVFLDASQVLRHPQTKVVVPPKLLGSAAAKLAPGEDPRIPFAAWLTAAENPWFTDNIVNRIWFWLLGRGIVHEPDDMRPTNPPSNPELLAWLRQELIAQKFDLKHIYRLILNSATYQRSSTPNTLNRSDQVFFSHYPIKRLTAEQASDALGGITLKWESFSSQIAEPYSHWPGGFHAAQMADGSVSTPFLELFGRPPRDTAYEGDRDCRTSMRQSLYLITSADLEARVAKSPRIEKWIKDGLSDRAVIEEMFLLALSRLPTAEELRKAEQHLAKDTKKRSQAIQDLMWAVLNTKEFLFNH